MTYQDWLAQWLYLTKPNVKQCTYERYSSYVNIQIIPRLGCYELDDLTVRVIQNFVTGLSETYSSGTVNCVLSVVKRSIASAEEMEVKKTRLNGRIRYRVKRARDVKCLTLDNQRKLENYINLSDSPKLYGITICLYTGLRVGELLALEWSDIDFHNSVMTVNKTCHDVYDENGYSKMISTPKTYTSCREIPLPKQLVANLRRMRRESKSEYVISGKGGKTISKRSYQNTFSLLLKKLGLPHMGIHALRHTFATRALECGMDVKTLSEILGHANATITLNCYVHSLPEHKRLMMNKVGKMLQ